MALPASGAISMGDVNTELTLNGNLPTDVITLNDAAVRTLFGKSSGAISLSDGYGKSFEVAYLYQGVIDTIGYRAYGRYFDGLGQNENISCGYTTDDNCGCCDNPDEYGACICYHSTGASPQLHATNFSGSRTGGYYETANGISAGFVSFGAGGSLSPSGTDCIDCDGINAWYLTNGSYGASVQIGVKKNGTLWAWGNGSFGVLGLGNLTSRSSPTQVGAGTNWRSVSVNGVGFHVLATKTDGTLWAWGYNASGQLGDGTTLNRSSPVQIGAGTNWATVIASNRHQNSFAIKTDGTLWAWGNAGQGTLGLGDATSRSSPTQVGALTNWAKLSSGGYTGTTFAIKTDGTLWSWGYNADGELGNGLTATKSSPIQIGAGTSWKSVEAGGYINPRAIKTDGTLWGWGSIVYGFTSATHVSSPVQMSSNTFHESLMIDSADDYHPLIDSTNGYPVITKSGTVVLYNSYGTTAFSTVYSGGSATKLIRQGSLYGSMYLIKDVVNGAPFLTQNAIFAYGNSGNSTYVSVKNLVNTSGVVAADVNGVGAGRQWLAAAGYGVDKAIFGYGYGGNNVENNSMTNLVSNVGVVATDTAGVGTARYGLAAASYGTGKAIFGYGYASNVNLSMTNLVSDTGVVSSDTTGVGTARYFLAAASYGIGRAIFGYGAGASVTSITNLVSNVGVVATDTTGVGTARYGLAAASYGVDKAIFGYGHAGAMTNLVSNVGVVATDTAGVGTARQYLAAASYGLDKAIFGYGTTGSVSSLTNKVSNVGVVAANTTGVGTARESLAAAGYGL